MKILFVWTGVTSYMADCWRTLASTPSVQLRVLIVQHKSGSWLDAATLFRGLDWHLVDDVPETAAGYMADGSLPEVIFAVGWHSRLIRALVSNPKLKAIPKVCCMDMPWRWRARCVAARWVLRPFLRAYCAAYVPGANAARYARWLGFRRIETGLFSLAQARFHSALALPARTGFLYVGRFAPEKRLDLLLAAFARYRARGGAWSLSLYGNGTLPPLSPAVATAVKVHDFVQAEAIAQVYAQHAVLILTSAFDPWPLVMLEARVAGCAVLASERCGNAEELGAEKLPYGDVEALCAAMLRCSQAPLQPSAAALTRYDCSAWASRVVTLAQEVTEGAT